MKSRRWIAVLATLGLAVAGRAASIVAFSEDRLIDTAEVIVHGSVLGAETAIIRGAVVTEASLEVQEVLKGSLPGPVVHVVTAGGDLGDQAVHVPGAPSFRPGEVVCVFLQRSSLGWLLTGASQGKYRLEADPGTGLTVARQSQAGMRVAMPQGGQTWRQALQAASLEAADWDAFRRRIRTRVGGTR